MTPKDFILTYYAVDENEFEHQKPFLKLSLSDLSELLSAYGRYLCEDDQSDSSQTAEREDTAICYHCGDVIKFPTCRSCEMQLTMPTEEY